VNDFDPPNSTTGNDPAAALPVDGPAPPPTQQAPPSRRGFFSRKRNIALAAGIAAAAIAGVTTGLVVTSGSDSTAAGTPNGHSTNGSLGGGGDQGSNARTTNEPGGTAGTVSNVSGSGFTVTTTIGAAFTVNESSSTEYSDASSDTSTAATASTVTNGAGVLVLGTVNDKTITATQVTIEPAGSAYTTASSDVTALQQGQKAPQQALGTIPSDYTNGEGTIVTGDTADKAVAAALQKYPGGIVDRVVQLSSGDYEVHTIGTNLHHIFENSSFDVIGAS